MGRLRLGPRQSGGDGGEWVSSACGVFGGLKRNGVNCNWPRCRGSRDGGGGTKRQRWSFDFPRFFFFYGLKVQRRQSARKAPTHTQTNKVERTVNCLSAKPRSDVHIIYFPKKKKKKKPFLETSKDGTWNISTASGF